MTVTLASLKQKLQEAELGDRLRVMGEARILPLDQRFELACLAKDDVNARIRYDAISQLSSLGHQDLGKALTVLRDRLLNDPETDVRAAAADSIAALKLTEAFEELVAAFRDSNEWLMQFSVIAALGELGDRRAFAVLTEALAHPESLVRLAAIGALGELGDPRALPFLVPLAADQEWDVRHRVVQALGNLANLDDPVLDQGQIQALIQELSQDHAPQVADAAKALLA
ncbi:MAG: HEAT repeat domain-containing protein [Pseudanabaenaceae cyanobacterium bins.68]|nr:HEAT repeat domain-containing protein [Pseudanabaenaceae cyanobacterium bins.68]